MDLLHTAVWRSALMVATYTTGPIFRLISLNMDLPQVPSHALQLQLIDLLLPSLLSSYNLPITVNQMLYMGPLNFFSGLLLWLHPSQGICSEICRRAAAHTAARSTDKDLLTITRYVLNNRQPCSEKRVSSGCLSTYKTLGKCFRLGPCFLTKRLQQIVTAVARSLWLPVPEL